MDRTAEMTAFVRAVETGGFSAAARDLGLTPSALSKLVGRLEDRLGVRLLHRTTRRLQLTAEGETFLNRARPILTGINPQLARALITSGTDLAGLPTLRTLREAIEHCRAATAKAPAADRSALGAAPPSRSKPRLPRSSRPSLSRPDSPPDSLSDSSGDESE